MKFFIGFVGGLVVGVAGVIAYSVQTGQDLREVVDGVRSDVSRRDFDALGARIGSQVTEMQRDLESRITQIREKAAAATDSAGESAAATVAEAVDAGQSASETVDAAVAEAVEAVEAVDPKDAAEGQAGA